MKTTRWRSLRLSLMLVGIAVCIAPSVVGQWIEPWIETENLFLSDRNIAPGEIVVAQHLEVYCKSSLMDAVAENAVGPGWNDVGKSMDSDGGCATTSAEGAWLDLETFDFNVPTGAMILGIDVVVRGAVDGGTGGVNVGLWSLYYGSWTPTWRVDLPAGGCGTSERISATDWEGSLWGRSWTRDAVNGGLAVELTAWMEEGATVHVDGVEVRVVYGLNGKLESLTVSNTAMGADAVEGAHIDRIEIVRVSDGRVIGSQTNGTQLAKLTGVGVPVAITSTYQGFTSSVELEIRIRMKATVPLLKNLELGNTLVKVTGVGEAWIGPWPFEWARFEVGPAPDIAFDGSIADGEVYRGQQFLAGRILVDTANVPFELTVTQLIVKNEAVGTKLTGTSIEKIEIRRASDDAVLGQASAAEIGKLTTGTTITTTSNNKVAPYTAELLEIWVTLKAGAPAGGVIKLGGNVQCGGVNFDIGDDGSPLFTVEQPRGFEAVTNDDELYLGMLIPANVFAGQRFLAQRIECADIDANPHDVTVNSVVVQNLAVTGTKLAESQIASIEAVRASDGASMGTTSTITGLNSGGTRITLNNANLVSDDMTVVLELWVTLKNSVPHDRWIQLQTKVWHTEDGTLYGYTHEGAESVEFVTAEADVNGLDDSTVVTMTDRQVFQGARFVAQNLKLQDNDADPYSIVITSLMIRNAAGDNLLSDPNVAKVEVRRKFDGVLLGEVTDPVGLSLAGVRIATAQNNAVQDDGIVELEIWVTLKTTAPMGRKLKLESVVWHTEGTVGFQTDPLTGPANFTTAEGDPPTNVDFTWTPELPAFEDEITFTPAANIGDPEGAIANATFTWEFGDGSQIEETTGTAAVTHTYAAGGTFEVTLSVTGEDGLTSTKTNEVVVEGPPTTPPEVVITAAPANPAISEQVDFTATIADADQPAGTAHVYAWEFGDADDTTSALAAPSFTYDTAGTYTVTLTVTDDADNTDTATLDVSVGNEPPVVGGVTATPTTANTGSAVEFATTNVTDPDGDEIGHYEWNFGDGVTDVDGTQQIEHIYAAPNTYTVSVVAVDVRGGRSKAVTLQITVEGPTRVVMRGFPNPALTTATIEYFLPTGATDPELWIFDLNRNEILRQNLPSGATEFEWNLRDEAGTAVSNGLYFCMITATSATDRGISSDVFRLLVAR